jgi:DNA-binding response OmpR family regulator
MNVLLAEDERNLANAVAQILRENKYQVDVAYTGTDALAYIEGADYDVFVCDVMLPGMNGFDIVKQIRKEGINTPTIMLTARTSLADKVTGLDAGADDYLTKPFQPAELLARLRALTRRQGEVVVDQQTCGDLTLDLSSYDLTCGDKSVRLSYKEFEVLSLLIANMGRTLPKETLISRIWGIDSDAGDNNVEAYISFLRKKLNYLNSTVQIVTQRKVGYRLEAE